ncbi:MAG TPA: POTRA domain-containing protein, partial [Methyloradius sp.]
MFKSNTFHPARLFVMGLVLLGNIGMQPAYAADAASDAQEQIRQQERERAQREQLAPVPDVRIDQGEPAAPLTLLPKEESPCFTIHSIALTGDSSSQFQWALASANQKDDPAVGRCLGSQSINIVMKRIQNAIVARGFVTTRVLAAPQDLNTGVLTLTLIPGRIHAIRFAPDTSQRATQWNAIAARPGDILNLRDIEQSLENFKRVPTADADIQITPATTDNDKSKNGEPGSSQPGLSDLVISWKQAFPLRLTLSADNSGIKSTGKNQGSVTISGDDLLSLNDLFYISYNHDLGGRDLGSRGT